MGYRNYISRIEKINFVKNLLIDDYDYQRKVVEDLYEIGKYYSHPSDGFEIIHDLSDEDTEFKVITRDSLKSIIKQFTSFHLEYLHNLLKSNEELDEIEKIKLSGLSPFKYIQEKLSYWEKADGLIYNLDLDTETIVESWNYEYAVFELIRIYKTFDEENYYLVYRGS